MGDEKYILDPIGVKVFTRLNENDSETIQQALENEIETNYQAQEAACPLNIRSLSQTESAVTWDHIFHILSNNAFIYYQQHAMQCIEGTLQKQATRLRCLI